MTPDFRRGDILRKQITFGYTSEEISVSLKEMAEKGRELTYSMGDDTPLPPLSEKPQLLFRYFRQRFYQVTNPPIDPIRERIVMSLRMALGHKMNFLREMPEQAKRLLLDSPYCLKVISGISKNEIIRSGEDRYHVFMAGAEQVSEAVRRRSPDLLLAGR
jgi:glutamate synthase (NADPH/NADH) large chain